MYSVWWAKWLLMVFNVSISVRFLLFCLIIFPELSKGLLVPGVSVCLSVLGEVCLQRSGWAQNRAAARRVPGCPGRVVPAVPGQGCWGTQVTLVPCSPAGGQALAHPVLHLCDHTGINNCIYSVATGGAESIPAGKVSQRFLCWAPVFVFLLLCCCSGNWG